MSLLGKRASIDRLDGANRRTARSLVELPSHCPRIVPVFRLELNPPCRGFTMERRAIVVDGVVQGVGFRPFVFGLALRLELSGFVKNRSGGVLIEVEGSRQALEHFLSELAVNPPPLARIEQVTWEKQDTRGENQFRIETSEADGNQSIFISSDIATCKDCLAELFDPAKSPVSLSLPQLHELRPPADDCHRRPYDRQRTTMASFPMCPACREEYEDPQNRRFHAQPTCCAVCGPRLQLFDESSRPITAADPVAHFAAALRSDRIGAMKGLGGYHLICDASSAAAVGELRNRKHRDEKPFALMVARRCRGPGRLRGFACRGGAPSSAQPTNRFAPQTAWRRYRRNSGSA